MEKLIRLFDPREVDAITIAEVKHFAEVKYNEQEKIKGQIARDLARIGENAFQDTIAYRKLAAKYKAAHAGKKKLTILENMKKLWCKDEEQDHAD